MQKEISKLIKVLCVFVLSSMSFLNLGAQVTLSTDFTSDTDKKAPLHEMWDVANRISPKYGSNVRTGLDINLVRMIGGIVKKVDGVKVPDLDYDPCLYDSVNNVYVYRWEPLLQRLGKIVNGQTKIHQIVLDQPPWAFQHGYEFIPEGTTDGVHFREDERVTTYGNSLPPKDKEAYFDFVKAMIEKLIEEFGQEEVESWRFRVGSEIETPDHWPGTAQDFVEHFANTERAVRAVLPNAMIGVHTRRPSFLYKDGVPKNYKGQPYASFANDIIEYCDSTGVKYDFWGVSDYVLINVEKYRDISTKYDGYFEGLQTHPKWNSDCTLDLMEYSTVITMNADDDRGYLTCASTHKDIVELGLSHLFYRNGTDKIFRWGQQSSSSETESIAELRGMVGDVRYETSKSGSPKTSTNQFDAIFTINESGDEYDVMVYSFNVKSLNYINAEPIKLFFSTDLPAGTKLYYRNNYYGIEHNKLQQFLKKEGTSWLKTGWDEKGAPDRSLTEAGLVKYNAFTDYQDFVFNEWKSVVTIARTDGGDGSVVEVATSIPSFSFKKFEFRSESELISKIAPLEVQWTSTEDFSPWQSRTNGMRVNTENDKLSLTFSDGYAFPMAGVEGLNIQADLFDTMRIVMKNSTPEASFQMAANVPGTDFSSGRKKLAIPNDNQTQVLIVDLNTWAQWDGVITDFKIYNNVNSGTLEIDTIEFISSATAAKVDVMVEQEGLGLVNYSSGACFVGQEFDFTALAEPGWMFTGWIGDISSTSNLLNVTVDSSMIIKAVFSLVRNLTIATEGHGSLSHSSGPYADGQALDLLATPASGWEFTGWIGDTVSSENPLTLPLASDMNITAVFSEIKYYVTISQEGDGTISHNSDYYLEGQGLVLTATPATGMVFSAWSGDTISTENPLTISVDSTMTITATFVEETTAVNENAAESVLAYPNPSSNGVFSVKTLTPQTWNVYNVSGTKVLTGTGEMVNLSSEPKGVYLLKMDESIIMLLSE